MHSRQTIDTMQQLDLALSEPSSSPSSSSAPAPTLRSISCSWKSTLYSSSCCRDTWSSSWARRADRLRFWPCPPAGTHTCGVALAAHCKRRGQRNAARAGSHVLHSVHRPSSRWPSPAPAGLAAGASHPPVISLMSSRSRWRSANSAWPCLNWSLRSSSPSRCSPLSAACGRRQMEAPVSSSPCLRPAASWIGA